MKTIKRICISDFGFSWGLRFVLPTHKVGKLLPEYTAFHSGNGIILTRFDVLTAVLIKIHLFWNVTPFRQGTSCRHFGAA